MIYHMKTSYKHDTNQLLTLCNCGNYHSDLWYEEYERKEKMALINQKPKKPSTQLDIQLVCGCVLRERFEFYKTKTPRNFKTLLRRIYDKEEDQSEAIKGKSFVNLVASDLCVQHWVEPKPKPSRNSLSSTYLDIRNALLSSSLTQIEAELLIDAIRNRINR